MAELDDLLALYNAGRASEAAARGEALRATYPDAPLLHNVMAAAYSQLGRTDLAARSYAELIRVQPNNTDAYNNLGIALVSLGHRDKAVECFQSAIRFEPSFTEAYNNLGFTLNALGRHSEAIEPLQRAVQAEPNYADAHNNLGVALARSGDRGGAITAYQNALRINGDNPQALVNLANALTQSGKPEEALQYYARAIGLAPTYPDAHNNLGFTLSALGRHEAAIASFERALQLQPDFADAYNNLGIVLAALGRIDDAARAYGRALELAPNTAQTHSNLGNALVSLGRAEEALAHFDRALVLDPRFAEAHSNRGLALRALHRHDEAVDAFTAALALKPDAAEFHNSLGVTLAELRRHTEAIAAFTRALELDPDYALARAQRLHQQARICDWAGVAADADRIPTLGVEGGVVPPFALLAMDDAPARNRVRAERFAREMFPRHAAPAPPPAARPQRLKLGYFSADFHDHATMYLMARLFELHDCDRFELHAFSYGPDRQDAMRVRARAAFHQFHDVRTRSDQAIAAAARAAGIDIAINLKGYTEGGRPEIFAQRAAPVQISFLGYPGTMGAPFIDYLVADPTLIPPAQRAHYSESIIALPHTYQVNDNTRAIASRTPPREELGLPADSFVFCSFNNTYKITRAEFDIWMQLLRQVDGSVLWLLQSNTDAAANLKREASARGVEPARLVFAPPAPHGEHLARCRAADLFLDTFACNAHTTASDALWAGLPIVTLPGDGLIARVAASVLNAIDLPELVTHSRQDYAALALDLATNPARLAEIRRKLDAHRLTTPLFDTARFARHIEAAYDAAYQRYLDGKPPGDIAIPA